MGNFPKLPKGMKLEVGSHQTTIVEYLSEGGFAHIYKVEIDPPESGSNIGCLKRVIVPDKSGLNQLRREVDVMKTLRQCRNIVKYYDSHAERLENGTYQVLVLMELCPNKSLLHYMNARIKTKLTEPEILKIMLDISQGIYEMHKINLIHRDIKIENVLIDDKNQFKLCDFGSTSPPIKPPQDQHQFQLLSHDILYQTTPQYRSPEMIDLYKGIPIDEKSDIWALGCFLYKLCYYTTPFEANGDVAILRAIFHFPSKPQYSPDLKNLIIIILQENPNFRPNIVQVIMLICKMLKIDFNELGIDDFYNAGSYNFQALHDYQLHVQQEIVKQQLYQQQQQQVLSQHNSTVNLQKDSQISRSHTPHSKNANINNHQVLPQYQNQQPNVTNSNFAVSNHDKYDQESQKSLKSSKSTASVISVAKQNSSNYVDLENSSDYENLDNVEQRYPSLDDFLDPASSQLPVTSSDPLKKSTTQFKTNNDRTSNDQLDYQSSIVNESVKPLENIPPFNKKEAWTKLKSSLNEEAVKLVDDIFSRSVDDSQSNKPTIANTHTAAPIHYRQASKENVYLHQVDDDSDSSDLDDFSENIDNKFPEIPQISDKIKILNTDATSENSTQKLDPLSLLRKSFESTLPHETEYLKEYTEFSPTLQTKEIPVKTPVIGTNEFLVTTGDNRLMNSLPQAYAKSEFAKYNSNQLNNNTNNPFPLPSQNQDSNPVHELECVDESRRDANPWGEYRKKSQIGNGISVPTGNIPNQSYQSSQGNTSNLHENFERLSLNNNNNLPAQREKYPVTPKFDESKLNAIPSSTTNSEANQYPPPNAVPEFESINRQSYQNGSTDLNYVNMRLRQKPSRDFVNEHVGSLSLKDSIKVRKLSGEEPINMNLIDLDIPAQYSAITTPTLKKINPLEEPSLLDLDAEEEKKQEKLKKRISSIQDQKWEQEVIDFASDDENPENDSRMNRLSIRSSLKKPKRKSGEFKRP